MSETLDMQARVARLQTMLAEGRVIRGKWSNTAEDGRERACLLAALSPEVARAGNASACPADVMPEWFRDMVPVFDDNGSGAVWQAMAQRFAALASRWHALTDEDWRRLDYTARRVAVEYARQYAGSAVAAVDAVLSLLRRGAGGAASSAHRPCVCRHDHARQRLVRSSAEGAGGGGEAKARVAYHDPG